MLVLQMIQEDIRILPYVRTDLACADFTCTLGSLSWIVKRPIVSIRSVFRQL